MPDAEGLTATEAAARLGVKRATLYAYVSRGLVHRQMSSDGRTSRFDPAEIDRFLSERRTASREGELDTIVATALTRVRDDELTIRGADVVELIIEGAGFEAIVDLLWDAPANEPWLRSTAAEAAVAQAVETLPPHASPTDKIRLTCVTVSALDPLRHDLSPKAIRVAGRSLISAMTASLATGPATGPTPSASRTASSSKGATGTISNRVWGSLAAGRGSPAKRRTVDVALALLADHGLASSTFGARIAASVRADPYSVVLSGLGIVGGSMHGAASAAVHDVFEHAHTGADASVAVGEARLRLGYLPGFGHSVYTSQDPRYGALMSAVSAAWGSDRRLATIHHVRDVVSERTDAIPNVDFALGALTWLARMDSGAGEAIFTIARTAGWLAHAVEEYEERPIRFRPRARYVGP